MINVEKTIISQYANSPTIVTLCKNVDYYLDPRADIDAFYSFVWNVDTAQGFGLDTWGRIVNVDRSINVPANTPNPGNFAFTSGAYLMTDSEYRSVILIKALANITSCTAASLNQLIQNLFAGRGRCYVNDMGSMTMRYTFEFYLKPFEYVIISGGTVAPRPAGVQLDIIQIDPLTTFGFFEGVQLQPFDQGTFYTT